MMQRFCFTAISVVSALLAASACGQQKDARGTAPADEDRPKGKSIGKSKKPGGGTAQTTGKGSAGEGSQTGETSLPDDGTVGSGSDGTPPTSIAADAGKTGPVGSAAVTDDKTPATDTGTAGPNLPVLAPVVKGVTRLRVPLSKPLLDALHDVQVRQSDGALVAMGESGTVWISKDDAATWTPNCRIIIGPNSSSNSMFLSSVELGRVIAFTGGRLYTVDEVVEDVGPCPSLPRPAGVSSFSTALLSRKRILARGETGYVFSDNLGTSWSPLPLNLGPNAAQVVSVGIAIDHGNPQRIVVATCEKPGDGSAGTRLVLRSGTSDAAPLVTSVACGYFGAEISLEPGQPDTLYYRSNPQPMASIDGGKSWFASPAAAITSTSLPEGGFARVEFQPASQTSGPVAHFKFSPGGKVGGLALKSSFPVSALSDGNAFLRGGKGKFLYSIGRGLFASFDGGISFKSVKLPSLSAFSPVEVASRNGKTLWAVDRNSRVAMSPDGGSSWSIRYMGPGAYKSPTWQMRIYVHPYNDTSMLLHEEGFGKSSPPFRIATDDAFVDSDAQNIPWFMASSSVVGYLPSEADTYYVLNSRGVAKGKATSDQMVSLPLPPPAPATWSPFPDMLALPAAPNTIFFGTNGTGSAPRYEAYNVVSGAKRDILPALGMTPAGHAIALSAQGVRLRVISETGRIRETADGITFNDRGGNPSFPACGRRLLAVSHESPARMVTACLGSTEEGVRLTTNGGKEWTHFPGSDFENCALTQVAVTDSRFFASCSNAYKVFEVAR